MFKPPVNRIDHYNTMFNLHLEREDNKNQLFGFKLSKYVDKMFVYINGLHKMLLRMDSHSEGSMFNPNNRDILVCSFRPNIGFQESVVFNWEYNRLAEEKRCESDLRRSENKKRLRDLQLKENIRQKQEEMDRLKTTNNLIELSNRFLKLQGLCDDHNAEDEDSANPETCVEESLSVRHEFKYNSVSRIESSQSLNDHLNELINRNNGIKQKNNKSLIVDPISHQQNHLQDLIKTFKSRNIHLKTQTINKLTNYITQMHKIATLYTQEEMYSHFITYLIEIIDNCYAMIVK
jgi:hypothetical protein